MYIMVNSNDLYGTIEAIAVDHNVHSDRTAKEQHYKRLKPIIFKKWARPLLLRVHLTDEITPALTYAIYKLVDA